MRHVFFLYVWLLTLLTLLPPPMGVKMQHTCAEIDYSSPNQATILLMPDELKETTKLSITRMPHTDDEQEQEQPQPQPQQSQSQPQDADDQRLRDLMTRLHAAYLRTQSVGTQPDTIQHRLAMLRSFLYDST